MDTAKLEEDVKIIMNKELDVIKNRIYLDPFGESGLVKDYPYSYEIRYASQTIYTDAESSLLYDDKYAVYLNFPTLDTLIKLFGSISHDKTLVEHFVKTLTDKIISAEFLVKDFGDMRFLTYDIAYLPFAALLKLKFTKEAIYALRERSQKLNIYASLRFLNRFLTFEYDSFDDAQLNELENFLSKRDKVPTLGKEDEKELEQTILKQIHEIRFRTVEKRVEGIIVEINKDEEKVILALKDYGFNKNLIEFLNEVDELIYSSISKAVSSGLVNGFRKWTEDLVQDIAQRMYHITKKAYPTSEEKPIGNCRLYLKKELPLSTREDEFIDAFVNLLHVSGGHSITSDKKYFRLVRNIAIELAYFLLTKLSEFETTHTKKR